MYYFTSDEHYNHKNAIKYNNRPFEDVRDMNEELISRHNSVVKSNDVTFHAGDFAFGYRSKVQEIIARLNGSHVFLMGSHDQWLGKNHPIQVVDQKFNGQFIVICHYAMRVWARSHYGSWHLYGHSHGRLPSQGKSHDIGVDNNDYYPLSLDEIAQIMNTKPENLNMVRENEKNL